ncbi:hypothetical protein B0H63DRAFT_557549 [Podospora didyma]|uniref:Uncharacterized protein n=1 Tax=Podospora didyma TaxID=330526 RepID=A0AAE0NZI8_9PEZI|nr:hypothetical protein B0H63DRAFT_557549 [Podospora didyma]
MEVDQRHGRLPVEGKKKILSRAVGFIQTKYIRAFIPNECTRFQVFAEAIFRHARGFELDYSYTLRNHESRREISDETSFCKYMCEFVMIANEILAFLDFMEQETGLCDGGEPTLKNLVGKTQDTMKWLVETLILRKVVKGRPGFELGLEYTRDVWMFGDTLFLLNGDEDPEDINLNLHPEWFSAEAIMARWHRASPFHPATRVPGTPWHKFIGASETEFNDRTTIELFDNKPKSKFIVMLPENGIFIEDAFRLSYIRYRFIFENAGRMPPYKDEWTKHMEVRTIQSRLSSILFGWKSESRIMFDDHEGEGIGSLLRFNSSGNHKFESMNEVINLPILSGIAIVGQDIDETPDEVVIIVEEYSLHCDPSFNDNKDEEEDNDNA